MNIGQVVNIATCLIFLQSFPNFLTPSVTSLLTPPLSFARRLRYCMAMPCNSPCIITGFFLLFKINYHFSLLDS